MTKLIVRKYEVDDFMDIILSRVEEANQIGQPVEEWGKYHKIHGPAVTVLSPGREILFCCGAHHIWDGCAECWAIYSPLVKKYPSALRLTKELLERLYDQFGYYRLQGAVDPRFTETIRFVEHLGFKQEGLMRRYGPHGEDRILYALVKEDKNAS